MVGTGDWRSGSALPSHGRGHWFEPSIAHDLFQQAVGAEVHTKRDQGKPARQPYCCEAPS